MIASLLSSARVYDLAQDYSIGIPHFPTHPPFLYSLTKQHGEVVASSGSSSAADSIAMGTHNGTHIDALCHFSRGGMLHGGVPAADCQSYHRGISHLGVETIAPILRRGVLLDIAAEQGVPMLSADFAITPEHLQSVVAQQHVSIQRGDVVLLRTGWGQLWSDPKQFLTGGGPDVRGPGPQLPGAEWLSRRGAFAVGSDTVAFEHVPAPGMPVHVHLLVECGIHIIEVLNLEELARDHVYEFAFIALPLKISGATGSPIRPVALSS